MIERPPTIHNDRGFSLTELMISLTLTLVVIGMAFFLVAQSLNRKSRDESQAEALADATQALSIMSREISNAGFGLLNNGITADSTAERIRIRANLNSTMRQTTSNSVSDPDEDVVYQLVSNAAGRFSLVRTDVGSASTSVVATDIDNTDGNGVAFRYLDAAGNTTSPQTAVRIQVLVRVRLPQVGEPGTPGFQPQVTKELSSSVYLRNARLVAY